MMEFDDIWSRFSHAIDEMNDGMCHFEGYVPSVSDHNLLHALLGVFAHTDSYRVGHRVWADDATDQETDNGRDVSSCVDLLLAGRVLLLGFDYEFQTGSTQLRHRLIIEKNDARIPLEILCDRGPILSSPDPRSAVADAISEFRRIKRLFKGDALFVGPDTVQYPENADDYPSCWLRVE